MKRILFAAALLVGSVAHAQHDRNTLGLEWEALDGAELYRVCYVTGSEPEQCVDVPGTGTSTRLSGLVGCEDTTATLTGFVDGTETAPAGPVVGLPVPWGDPRLENGDPWPAEFSPGQTYAIAIEGSNFKPGMVVRFNPTGGPVLSDVRQPSSGCTLIFATLAIPDDARGGEYDLILGHPEPGADGRFLAGIEEAQIIVTIRVRGFKRALSDSVDRF